MDEKKQTLAIYLLLALTTLVAFQQVGNHGFIQLDDSGYIVENGHIQDGITIRGLLWAFTTGYAANWHPLTWISHMLDIQFFGLDPHWHHLTNLFFHIANVLLLFFALNRMTKALWQSAFTAALFALHPLHVESVAWISERKDVLSTFFWMLTLVAYSYHAQRPGLKSYLAVIALFALGLMAKPMLVTLPFVLLLLDYWPLARFAKSNSARQNKIITVGIEKPAIHKFEWALIRPLLLEKIPLFALTALSCAAAYIAHSKGGAVAPIEMYTPCIRIANAFVSYLIYIAKTIRPDNLALFYPHPGLWPLWQFLGAALLLAAITVTVILKAKRFPYLPVGWLWFTGTLVPVIGIVQVGSQALADRYMYIPSIGLFIMAAWGVPEILRKRRYGKEAFAAFSVLCLLCIFILTRTQVSYWQDGITLSEHALNVTQRNFHMYILHGMTEYHRGNYGRAVEDFDRAIEINPDDDKAYFDRGYAYNGMGNYMRSVEDFSRAIEINSGSAQFYNDRGVSYMALGDEIHALEDFNRAVEIDPQHAQAYFNRGCLYQSSGKYRQAIDDYDKAIETGYPVKEDVFCNRGAVYGSLGDHVKALEDYAGAMEINPEHARTYYNRGVDYASTGDHLRALRDFDRAIQIDPEYADAYYFRGMARALLGDRTPALEDMKTAARLGSEDAGKFLKDQGLAW